MFYNQVIPGTAEANSYIDIIEKYLESYAYRDILLNPPAPLEYQAVDLLSELESLRENYPTNGFDYLEELRSILAKTKDAHTLFYPPCFSPFVFELPYEFELVVREDDSTQVIIHPRDHPLIQPDSSIDGFLVESIALDNTTFPIGVHSNTA